LLALACSGLLRVDFFLRPDGELVVNEVNTMPGFTAGVNGRPPPSRSGTPPVGCGVPAAPPESRGRELQRAGDRVRRVVNQLVDGALSPRSATSDNAPADNAPADNAPADNAPAVRSRF